MAQLDLFRAPARPWNTGRIIGPKPPLKPRHICAFASSSRQLGGFEISQCARPEPYWDSLRLPIEPAMFANAAGRFCTFGTSKNLSGEEAQFCSTAGDWEVTSMRTV